MNRWLIEALDHVAAVGIVQPSSQHEGSKAILAQAGAVLFRICPLESGAFFQLDAASMDFPLSWCEPAADQAALHAELDRQIEDGVFAWALQRNHPIIVPARTTAGSVLLHVLASRSGPMGMFLGTMAARTPFIPDGCQKLVSIVLTSCASHLRSEQLRAELRDINRGLEAAIEQRTAELRLARDTAFRAAQAKTEFLANMSHEIRTPMNAVLGTAAMLLESGLDDEQRSLAETIGRSGRDLLTIINDLLDFSRLEAGKLRVETIPFDLHETVRNVIALLTPKAEAKQIRLGVKLADGTPVMVQGDAGRLRQVLTNILDNAIKFTEHGFVMLLVGSAEDEPHPRPVRFVIRDSGIGIPPAKLDAVFEKFTQADSSTTRKYGGTGLGLTICRQLTELMGGRIWAESTVGAGSTFTVALPLAAPVSGDAVAESGADDVPARFTGRVLLAEDYPANQRIARWMLEKLGLEVDLAPDGRQALAKLESGQYDAVLMDCQMPELDGYEATRAIRASSASYRAIPVIAMTAAALPSDRERCLASGMSDYVSKPVQPKELARVLARWLRATSGD
jgi:signal transduction histidine kinase/ActR/RegA family two-component response regulator